MRIVAVSEPALIPSTPRAVYSLIDDYRVGHPSILPRRYFGRLESVLRRIYAEELAQLGVLAASGN